MLINIKNKIVCIDFGATKIDLSEIKGNRGKFTVQYLKQYSTPVFKSYPDMIEYLNTIIPVGTGRLFLAITGPVDEKKGIAYGGPNQFLSGPYQLKRELEKLSGLPVNLCNDVKMGAAGEVRYWKRINNFLFIMAGTGIAMETIINKKVISRGNAGLGEFGHMDIGNNLQCNCGRQGCLETISSGWALQKLSEKKREINNKDILASIYQDKEYRQKYFLSMINAWKKVLEPMLLGFPFEAIITNGSVGLHPVFIKAIKICAKDILKRHPLLTKPKIIKSQLKWKAIPWGACFMLESKEEKV